MPAKAAKGGKRPGSKAPASKLEEAAPSEAKPTAERTKKSGTLVFANGDSYRGAYILIPDKRIERCGVGSHIYADGCVLEGVWEKDKLIGQGKVHFPDGSMYEGDLKGIQFHGKGTYTFPDGTTITGTFKKNRLQDRVVYNNPDDGENWLGKISAGDHDRLQSVKGMGQTL